MSRLIWIRVTFIGLLALGFGLSSQVAWSQTFIQPGTSAPDGPIAPSLNSATGAQLKAGTLVVGDGGEKLCLNAEAATGLGDTINCITAWTDVSNSLSGRFVLLSQALVGSPFVASGYTKQSGFARVQSTGTGQSFSSIVTAPHVCLERFSGTGTVAPCNQNGAPGFPSLGCFCYGTGDNCSVNTDCQEVSSLLPATTRGVYATDGGLGTNNAAVFGGKMYVQGADYSHVGVGFTPAQICLNGTAAGNCISSWDQVTSLSSAYVKLQAYAVGQAVSPAEKQLGGTAVQASSGVINGFSHTSSILAGDPNSVGTVSCGGAPCICGNGQCATTYETVANCPIDCAAINQLSAFQVGTRDAGVRFFVNTASQSPVGNVHLLIVRSENAAATFAPQSGRQYVAGTVIGDTRIIFAGSVPQNTTGVSVPDDTNVLPNRTYYYKAYQANQFPRYANPINRSISLVQLTVTKTGSAGGFFGEVNGFTCSNGCSNRPVFYAFGATENITSFVGPGGSVTYSGACSGSGDCTVFMDMNKTLTGTFTSGF